MSCLHYFLSSAISSVMFSFIVSSSTTLLQVFFGLPTGLLPSTSHSITLLSILFSSLHFTWPNHLNLIFHSLCSRFSTPHLLLTSSLVISCPAVLLLTCISTVVLNLQAIEIIAPDYLCHLFILYFVTVISRYSTVCNLENYSNSKLSNLHGWYWL